MQKIDEKYYKRFAEDGKWIELPHFTQEERKEMSSLAGATLWDELQKIQKEKKDG